MTGWHWRACVTVGVAIRTTSIVTAITAAIEKQDTAAQRHTNEIADLKTEIKKLGDVLTALAVQENRLDMHEKWIDELRRAQKGARRVG